MKSADLSTDVDQWSSWLLSGRHGGDAGYRGRVREEVERIRDRVLDFAGLGPGQVLLDVGTGDGLVAFEAIARVGRSLCAILSDISGPLLRHARGLAVEAGVDAQCIFLEASADDLSRLAAETVDVVTSRAVLAYVSDRPAAMAGFMRVLKPGGRMVLAEPVNQDEALEACALGRYLASLATGLENGSADERHELLRLKHKLKAAQFPSTEVDIWSHPLTNYNERDLVRWADAAGFGGVHMEFHTDVRRPLNRDWGVFLDLSPYPGAKTAREVMSGEFSESERAAFERHVRPVIEGGMTTETSRLAYLVAEKPV